MTPVAAVSQAGVCDLEQGWRDDLGGGAVAGLLGSYDHAPERYALASPAALAPLGAPQLLVHGTADEVVPVSQSRDHAARDPEAELLELRDADHFDVIDPRHAAWSAAVDWLSRSLAA